MGQQNGTLIPKPEPPVTNPLFTMQDIIFSWEGKKVQLEDFVLLKVVGKGNFAQVLQVRKKDNSKIYAMKVLTKSHLKNMNQLEHIKTERIVLQHIDHPFLVKLMYAFQTRDKLYMVMEFVNGGELFFHLRKEKRFSEHRAKFYAAQLFLALEHLHKHNIIYRDLKPENILLDKDGNIKLTDFGLAKILSKQERTNTFCGTPEYLAPEILLQQGHGKPVDWWSFGTLLYEMIVGIPPFFSNNVQEMYNKILHAPLCIPEGLMSIEAQDILVRLLERNPKKRLGSGIKGSAEIKYHPFFRDINWDALLHKRFPAPFKPDVKSDLDTTYFDEEFTKQPVTDLQSSVSSQSSTQLNEKEQKTFEGFTFSGDFRVLKTSGVNLGSQQSVTSLHSFASVQNL